MVDKELSSDKYIKHHLQNLTFGYCESAKEWRFADGHINIGSKQEAYQEKKEFKCEAKDMGIHAIHVDTMAMSLILGSIFCFFFWRAAKKASVHNPTKFQNAIEYMFSFVRSVVNAQRKQDYRPHGPYYSGVGIFDEFNGLVAGRSCSLDSKRLPIFNDSWAHTLF